MDDINVAGLAWSAVGLFGVSAPPGFSIDVIVPVFNAGGGIAKMLDGLLASLGSEGADVGVIVCNDGSHDDTADRIAAFDDHRIRCINLPENRGRAAARNAAALASAATYLLFIDADCRPQADNYFDVWREQARHGIDVAYGPILADTQNTPFWCRYLEHVSARRDAAARAGRHLSAMTTGNALIRREVFARLSGFDEQYRRYGFEDRDLIARLLEQGLSPVYDVRASVLHSAGNTVAGYCRKMLEAARDSAPLFFARHPQAYREMSYARVDVDQYPAFVRAVLRPLAGVVADVTRRLAALLVDRRWVPWPVQANVVRSAAALSYLAGSAERSRR